MTGHKTPSRQSNQEYSEREAQQRFEKLVKAVLNTRPKTLKSMGPKSVPAQSQKQQAKTESRLRCRNVQLTQAARMKIGKAITPQSRVNPAVRSS